MAEHPTSDPSAGRGSDAGYCSVYPLDGHHMVSHSAGQKVRWVERCGFCGWIDAAALDVWADNAIKEALSARAARIAMAIESNPFSFHQPPSGELTVREVLVQALAAASQMGRRAEEGVEPVEARSILDALEAEVGRFIRLGEEVASDTDSGVAGSGDLRGADSGAVSPGQGVAGVSGDHLGVLPGQ